ncbi:MAG: hypothetical protein ABW321_27350, partial [Polyangiales bacterium]
FGGVLLMALAAARGVAASELHWRAPPECPDAQALALEVERVLGGPLDARAKLTVEAVVTQPASQ